MQTTKDKILSAVIDYIKDNTNLESITLSKIALTADIGKSTVYEHFSSKEELICQTYLYLLNHYQVIMMQELKSKTFREQFLEQMNLILTVMMDARILVDAIMNHHESFMGVGNEIQDTVKSIQKKMQERFKEIFMLGVEEGMLPIRLPMPYQENIIQAIMSGLLYQYANKEIEIEREDLFVLIYDSVIKMIK
jgi:AcrR family transcriptional regulator